MHAFTCIVLIEFINKAYIGDWLLTYYYKGRHIDLTEVINNNITHSVLEMSTTSRCCNGPSYIFYSIDHNIQTFPKQTSQ